MALSDYNYTLVDQAVETREAGQGGWDVRTTDAPDVRAQQAEMQRAAMTAPYTPYPTTGAAGTVSSNLGGLLGMKGYCSEDKHYFACKHEVTCVCGQTGRITVAAGL